MQALLDERSKRQRERLGKEDVRTREKSNLAQNNPQEDRSLKSIVESVKRKSGATNSNTGKRRKV